MKRDELRDILTSLAMEHLFPRASSLTTDTRRDGRAWVESIDWGDTCRHDTHHLELSSRGSTQRAAEKALWARVLARFIVRFCRATSVTVEIPGADTVVEKARTRKVGAA